MSISIPVKDNQHQKSKGVTFSATENMEKNKTKGRE